MFGPVASDPTVSRLIDVLAAAGPKALTAIRAARAEVRTRVWELAGADSPGAGGSVIVDIDGVLVLAHSEKQDATATWKKTFGHHPLVAFIDHGQAGSGEPVAALLRPGNAGSNTASDHITTAQLALAQLPKPLWRGQQTLIRTDSAGGTHAFLDWLSKPDRWLSYSVGMTIIDTLHQAVLKIPKKAWTPAYNAGGTERPGAWVAEITDMPDLSTWPKGMRLIVRKERPHPGAQLRFTDIDGLRLTCSATNTKGGQLAGLELRHHRPSPLAPPARPMALDRCHHPRNRPAPRSVELRLTNHFTRPDNPHHHTGEVETGAHPTRRPGPQPDPHPKRPHHERRSPHQQTHGDS